MGRVSLVSRGGEAGFISRGDASPYPNFSFMVSILNYATVKGAQVTSPEITDTFGIKNPVRPIVRSGHFYVFT